MLYSGQDGGQIIIRLRDEESLGRDLRTLLRTDKYLRTKNDGTLPATTRRIHRDLADDNRSRRERLTHVLGGLLAEANYFVAGQRLEIATSTPQAALDEAMEYLIRNTFTKMGYLKTLRDNPLHEIQAVLRSDDIAQQSLGMDLPEGNPQAVEDIRSYIELCTQASRRMVLHDIVTGRYAGRPYGWPDMEVILLLARLYMAGEIQFVTGGAAIAKDKLHEALTAPRRWRSITVVQRATSKPEDVKKARALGRDVFSAMGPDGEDALYEFLKKKLASWRDQLSQFRAFTDTGNYPGADDIAAGSSLVRTLLAPDESNMFLSRFNENRNALLDLGETFHDLEHFHAHQRPMWDKLRAASARFMLNQMELERDGVAGPALQRMAEILAAPNPYGLVKEAEGLIRTAGEVNDALLSERRARVLATLSELTGALAQEFTMAGADDDLKAAALAPLEGLSKPIAAQDSLAHIAQFETEAIRIRDQALATVERTLAKRAETSKSVPDQPVIKPRRVVVPAKLAKTTYLESQADVDAFLDALREELTGAINQNERIEIR